MGVLQAGEDMGKPVKTIQVRRGNNIHIIPEDEAKRHVAGKMTSCPCEPVTAYIEKTEDGYIWRRFLKHGHIR